MSIGLSPTSHGLPDAQLGDVNNNMTHTLKKCFQGGREGLLFKIRFAMQKIIKSR